MKKLKKFVSILLIFILTASTSGCSLYRLLNFSIERLDNPPSVPAADERYRPTLNAMQKTELQQLINSTNNYFNGALNEDIVFSWQNYLAKVDSYDIYTEYTKAYFRNVQRLSEKSDYSAYANFLQSYSTTRFNGYMQSFFNDGFSHYVQEPFSMVRYNYDDGFLDNIGHKEYEIVNSPSLITRSLQQVYDNFSSISKDYLNGEVLYRATLENDLSALEQLMYFNFSKINAVDLKSANLEFFLSSDGSRVSTLRINLEFSNESFVATVISNDINNIELDSLGYTKLTTAYSYYLKQIFPFDSYNLGAINFDYKISIDMPIEYEYNKETMLLKFNFYASHQRIVIYNHETWGKDEYVYMEYYNDIVFAIEPLRDVEKQKFGDMIYKLGGIILVKRAGEITQVNETHAMFHEYYNLFVLDMIIDPTVYSQIDYNAQENKTELAIIYNDSQTGLKYDAYPDLTFDVYYSANYGYTVENERLTQYALTEMIEYYAYSEAVSRYLFFKEVLVSTYTIEYEFEIMIPNELIEQHYYN